MTRPAGRGLPGVSEPEPDVVHLDGGELGADVDGTCAAAGTRARATGAHVVVCHAQNLPKPDLATVEALARLRLAVPPATRVALQGADPVLRALIDLAGLTDVLTDVPTGGPPSDPVPSAASPVEVQRQPEDAEVVGSDEVGDAADPAVTDLEQVDGPRLAPPGRAAGLVLGEGR